VARPPLWRHTLDEARRQALVAIDFYNRPGDRRSPLASRVRTTWEVIIGSARGVLGELALGHGPAVLLPGERGEQDELHMSEIEWARRAARPATRW